jgi:hypothetical protein
LANKSLLLITDVNQIKSTKQSTRAWANVRNAQAQILVHVGNYRRAWQALKSIGKPEDFDLYQKLEDEDLVVVKDITSAKRYGQGSERLAWFWRIGPSEDALTGKWMEECEIHLSYVDFAFHQIFFSSVYRVNWLRAKARVDRWVEEQTLVKHEMNWTILWFRNQRKMWGERAKSQDESLPPGHQSYAIKQEKLWNRFETKASERFQLHLFTI